jgi:hypothetical protein
LIAWEEALEELRESLDISSPLTLPTPSWVSLDKPSTSTVPPAPEAEVVEAPGSKRKATAASTAKAKKAKLDTAAAAAEVPRTGNGFMSVLRESDLLPPVLLTMEQTEAYIVKQQKAALLAEYGA